MCRGLDSQRGKLELAYALRAKNTWCDGGCSCGVEVAVQFEREAMQQQLCGSLREDMKPLEFVRHASIQEDKFVSLKSLARETALAKILSRIMAAVKALGATHTYQHALDEQHTTLLSAGGVGTRTTWTASNRSSMELLQNAQWRTAVVMGLGPRPDTDAATCALRMSP